MCLAHAHLPPDSTNTVSGFVCCEDSSHLCAEGEHMVYVFQRREHEIFNMMCGAQR